MEKECRFVLNAMGTFMTKGDPEREMRRFELYLIEKMDASGFSVSEIDLHCPRTAKKIAHF